MCQDAATSRKRTNTEQPSSSGRGGKSVSTSHEFLITVFATKSFYKALIHLMCNGVLHAFMHACAPGAYLILAETRRGCQVPWTVGRNGDELPCG